MYGGFPAFMLAEHCLRIFICTMEFSAMSSWLLYIYTAYVIIDNHLITGNVHNCLIPTYN
jgi:hypothetical protein